MSKKIVILVVLIECIFAVFLISFFGQALYNTDRNVACGEVYFVTESGEKLEDKAQIEVVFNDSNISYQLYWEVMPETATNKQVNFIWNNEDYEISADGLVTLLAEYPSVLQITIKTIDGSNKSAVITLFPKRDYVGGI